MKVSILTVFPEMFESFLNTPLVKRAKQNGTMEIETVDIKKFSGGCFRHIDDSPYGGGCGMIMRAAPVLDALKSVRNDDSLTLLLSPKGKPYSQSEARRLSKASHLILICGHYEGIDARVENKIDGMISIGDYVLSGGELAAEVICDSVVRLQDGVLRDGSADDETHENGLLEYPQYTRPAVLDGEAVPEVLLSGDKGKIEKWRRKQSLLETRRLRPDLFEKYELTEEDKKLLED